MPCGVAVGAECSAELHARNMHRRSSLLLERAVPEIRILERPSVSIGGDRGPNFL
jgi:hypothetical protein